MNDPHVVALTYKVEHDRSVDYSEAKRLAHEEQGFYVQIENEEVRFEFKEHYATEDAARAAIAPYIHRWEFDVSLRITPGRFKLSFKEPQIVDRSPTPGVANVSVHFRAGEPTVRVTVVAVPPEYPSPPSDLRFDPDNPNVVTMFNRYKGHCEGKEPLASAVYFCYTMLTNYLCKDKDAAVRKYKIGKKVLNEISRLSSTKGGPEGARKAGGVAMSLTVEEARFLKAAMQMMIRRVAEVAYGPRGALKKVTLAELPSLKTDAEC